MVEAVIFDMDGTLLDTERLTLDAFEAVATRRGLADLGPLFRSNVGLRADLTEKRLRAELDALTDFDSFLEDVDAENLRLRALGVPLKPHAREVLTALQARGLPLALATSSRTENAERLTHATGLQGFFEVIVGGDQVTHAKPHPEIYLKTAELIGIDPSRCAAFEDSDPGTHSAVAAGCVTVQVPDIQPPSDATRALGHRIAEDLREAAIALALLDAQSSDAA